MDNKNKSKQIARIVFLEIEEVLANLQHRFPNHEINFCWDECLWVDDDFFSGGIRSVPDDEGQ